MNCLRPLSGIIFFTVFHLLSLHVCAQTGGKDTTILQQVTVKNKKLPIEKTLDGVVVNVANSITAAGSSLFEVLTRAPGISVDQDDNIRLQAKSGVMIMIDGKPVQLTGTDLANMLKGMPASAIDKIEIITRPGSRYDAAGNAGVINIKMKKNQAMGANGTVTASIGAGVYPKASIGTTLNYRQGKINIFSNYTYSYRKSFSNPILDRQFKSQDTVQASYRQNDYISFPFHTQIERIGMDYTASSATTIGVVMNGLQNRFDPGGDNFSQVLDKNGEERSTFTTSNRSNDAWFNYAVNANLRHSFDTMGTTLTVDLDYARYWNRTYQTFTNNYYNTDGSVLLPTYVLYGELPGKLDIKSLKADYTFRLGKDNTVESGIKSSLVHSDNDIRFYDRSGSLPLFDSSKSNHFLYRENINAVYFSLSGKKGKIEYQAGLRVEQTNIRGDQLADAQRTDSSYVQLFPSMNLKYNLSQRHAFSFTVNRRIDRPTYKQLNPFKFYIDPTTYVTGDPYLRPQETYNIQADYILDQKLTTTLAYSTTKDNITEVLYPSETQDRITIQTNKNLRRVDYYSLTISYAAPITKWWSTVSEFIGYRGIYIGDLANTRLNRGSTTFNINATNNFDLGKGYSSELSFNYRAGEVYGYYYIRPIWQLNGGVQKSIMNGKGTLKLNYTDIFLSYVIKGNTSFTDYYESFVTRKETRVGTLSFVYRFGKKMLPAAQKRGSGAEEEKSRASTGSN